MKMVRQTLKHRWIYFTAIAAMVCVVMGFSLTRTGQVDAYGLKFDAPERKALISVSYTTYEWWLLRWSNSETICQVYVEHEGLPEAGEVEYYCGAQITEDWLATPPCNFSDEITSAEQCPGLYFHLVNVTPGTREIEVDLLPHEVFVDIAGCTPQPPENRCSTLPELHLMGQEPLPNEQIINIQGYLGPDPFTCEGSECILPLPATGTEGIQVQFWAESSFGDTSQTFTAQVRVIPWGDFADPDTAAQDPPQWYVDILSSQYMGEIESTCSQIWSAFPPVGGPPVWLSSPEHPEALITNHPYYYLAGSLINQGIVDATACQNGGLESPDVANQCGLESARPVINQWQNQFNTEIIQVARDTGIPSQLMKNIFSKESQFWPGSSSSYKEAGLGHLSDLGADTVLLWNPSFFSQFCPLVLETTRCQQGFGNLDITEQEMLRGALVQKVNAACPECPQGIDLRQVNFSINVFARSLLANCEQVGQILYNQTGRPAGETSFYEDLWRFTLVNYNAGSGCLSQAVQGAVNGNYPLTWENVKLFLEPGPCQASIDYVEDIASDAQMPAAAPSPTPTLPVPTPTSTPTSEVPIPTQIEPTPTPTEPDYPLPDPTSTEPEPYP
jgi:hypothetical protein